MILWLWSYYYKEVALDYFDIIKVFFLSMSVAFLTNGLNLGWLLKRLITGQRSENHKEPRNPWAQGRDDSQYAMEEPRRPLKVFHIFTYLFVSKHG